MEEGWCVWIYRIRECVCKRYLFKRGFKFGDERLGLDEGYMLGVRSIRR